ncbi:MAG: class I SAM-dependent methyltransferase, partial [bacterium]
MGKEKLFKFYNRSQEYFELAEKGHLKKTTFPIHREILNKCQKKKGLIVDLGCGTGLDISKMVSNNNFCLGIDISQLAIDKAKSRKMENTDFLKSDLENLPLENKSVDIITSFFTFEHLLNPEKVLSEADRILKENGEIFILCPNFSSPFRGAPVYGWYNKAKIFKKMFLSLSRIFSVLILRKKDFKVKIIDESLINFKKIG